MDIEINKRVAKYRKRAGMKQWEVAERLDMKSSTYSQMERVGDISAERIRNLAEIFNVDVKDLLYGESSRHSPFPTVDPEKFVILPAPPNGMSYIPAHNTEASLIRIYRNDFTKENQKKICRLFDYLRKHKKTELNVEKIINTKL